ncbi:MAG: non-ribosomal peptide synthetase, partial [Longimicrobiaceae bacterium]
AMEPVDVPGLTLRLEHVDSGTSKFDMFLEMLEDGAGLRGNLEYATDLWEAETVERMVALFLRLLEALAGDPALPVGRAALLEADEADARVRGWNRTARPYPRDASIHAVFAERAAAFPSSVALRWEGGEMTYGELDARSNRLAHRLVRLGVTVDQPVALLAERSAELVVALLAILKAGGAYLPINPKYPRSRTALMLEDSGARVLVTEAAIAPTLPAHGVRMVLLDADAAAIAAEPATPPAVDVPAEAAAYVMYTSGSTGRPKGVVVPHRAVLRLVLNADFARCGADETWLQLAPVAFDASTLELWAPLLNGGRMALYPPVAVDPAELGSFIRRHGVTSAWLTAGLFHQLVDASPEAIGGLHQLLAGGDVLSVPRVRRVLDAFPGVRLINGYGPTENTTFTCCHTVGAEWSGGPVPIGSPISGTRVYVLDEALRPVPIGVPGELFAGGDGVARGYLGRPAATAEKFVPDPFSTVPGARLYRTGDRVRWKYESAKVRECESEPDSREGERTFALPHSRTGVLEYLGRLDAQVKIRGFRIEPGEVEAVLQRQDGVRECAVVVREDAPGEKRLVAYVAGEAEVDALREALRRSLPDYLVPAAFVALDALPLTPNGKVDRKALPAPDLAPDEEAYVAPRTPVEAEMAAIWAEVLGRERVGATDDFFLALGGHSLAATRVISRVRTAFDVELAVRTLFESPTVEALARAVEAARAEGSSPARIGKITRAARVALAGAGSPASPDAG